MRGEIWTMRDDVYASKARPVVIVQSNDVGPFDSVVLCLLTSYDSSDIATRVRIDPSSRNGLERVSWVMTDKIASVSRNMLGKRVGVLEQSTLDEVSRQLVAVLGLASVR